MKSGIYSITHTSGKRYIGSSVNIPRRLAQHYGMLVDGDHHCWRLQKDWLRYNGVGFHAETLEYCEPQMLAEREQAWIDQYGRGRLYNTRMTVERSSGSPTGPFRNDPIARMLGCPGAMIIAGMMLYGAWKATRRLAR